MSSSQNSESLEFKTKYEKREIVFLDSSNQYQLAIKYNYQTCETHRYRNQMFQQPLTISMMRRNYNVFGDI